MNGGTSSDPPRQRPDPRPNYRPRTPNGAATGSAPTFRCWWPTDHCATGLTADDAADTYSALSNPSAYALLADERGWSPDKFEQRLGDNMTLLLLRG
jgi:hypothetical protein